MTRTFTYSTRYDIHRTLWRFLTVTLNALQLLNAPDDEKMSLELGGLTTQDFRYTQRSPQSALTCVRYASRFKETQTTLRSLLRSNAHSAEDVLSLLAAVLHLGEVEQEWNSDRPALVRGASVTHLVPLLGLEPDDLDDGLCHRVIQVAGKDIKVPLSAEQSAFTRDALAKDIYDRLFSCLVNAVNIQLSGDTPRHSPAPETSRKIALLDIFGFESFGCNRFEQLCINYVNEALQQRFARDTIVTVQAEYLAEGVPWEPVRFTDNSTVLDLLHGRAGVITLLNDECQVPGGSEAGFLNKLRIAHGACDRLRIDPTKPGAFSVVHYAGTVTYDCTAFLKKNRDALPSHTASVMLRSKISLLTLLFRSDKSTVAQPTGRSPAQHRMAPTTICSKLRTELRSLLKQLDASQVHYVRCLKPNSSKSSCEFHPALVARQLRSGGLVEAVRVIRSAYPHKMPHLECFRMCRRLRSGDAVDDTGQQTQLAQLLCERCHLNVKVGVSRVYFAPGAYESMMGMVAAVELQSWWRGRRCRREYWRVRCGVVKFQALVRAGQSRHRQAQSLAAAVVLQTWARVMARRLAFLRMLDSTRRIQALLRRGIARRRARERRRHRVVIQRALLCWLLRRLRRVEGVAVTEPGFCCSRSTQTVSGGGDMVGGCGGRVRLSRCERFLEACQEVRDCLPRRWDPRSWTAEGVYELCSFIVGATAAVALYAFHCSADGTDK